jgi:hypothetical protein
MMFERLKHVVNFQHTVHLYIDSVDWNSSDKKENRKTPQALCAKYRMFQKELYNFESLYMYSENMRNVLNCHNVAKHTQIYLG